jgi:DNA polymerase elongation subunit (family B)
MNIDKEIIVKFLEGTDPQKYIIAAEPQYGKPIIDLVINDPENGKYIEHHKYTPFLWFKEEVVKMLYQGNRQKIYEATKRFDVKISRLQTSNSDGYSPERLENGYKYIAKCKKSYNELINFFKYGGVDVFDEKNKKYFVMFSPVEQFFIQTGKRLFKGFDDYNDLHRLQFDLETEGLVASKHAIFQIGVSDNRGNKIILETTGDTPQKRRNSERENIIKFFNIIDALKPDVITGYNSESFDWKFLYDRCERLNIPIIDIAKTLNPYSKIYRRDATLKLGNEMERYKQTYMYGYSIIDISHAVRRAMSINSDIKSWTLKYITKYSEIAKENRVYVSGDKINSTWSDNKNNYAFNDKNGDWYIITDKKPLKENYEIVTGEYIVKRYLFDDLWETEQVDNIFNQASFLISKILPTSFMRSSTMGTAGQWKLIMAAWSYQNDLAIPETQKKRDFTGGLSRLLQVGYAKNVVKLDFAALYPKTQITWDVFPDLDISGVMKGLLTYVVDTRDEFKFLTSKQKKIVKKLQAKLKSDNVDINEILKEIDENKFLANLYDKKQLPLKILANSWFGSYGAPYIFNWGDTNSAEETTCRGRQSLRLMVRHFTKKHNFKPLLLDTDGCNFSFPDNVNDIKYLAKGTHWKTVNDCGKELIGLDAVLAEFNEVYMEGRMGLDIDDICNSTINFARKNYANDIDGKVKLVGNSIKSKKMPIYIEEFINKGIRMLLDGNGYGFILYYQEYVDKIYNYQIPLVKIASKSKVKTTVPDYLKKAKMKNKAGNPMPKQAHMELVVNNGLSVDLGDTIYYVNTGTKKNQGDLKTIRRDKMSKKAVKEYVELHGHEPNFVTKTEINCKLIDSIRVETDLDIIKEIDALKIELNKHNVDSDEYSLITERINQLNDSLYIDEYNVLRYLEAFNKKVKPLLVCFHPDVRKEILISTIKVKNPETKQVIEKLKPKYIFEKEQCSLVSGMPFKEIDQDSYEKLMTMEDKEIRFWDSVNKQPNYMEKDEWEVIRKDYKERMIKEKADGIIAEKTKLDEIFRKLELSELQEIITTNLLPKTISIIANISNEAPYMLVSNKWETPLCPIDDIFKYESIAISRNQYYLDNKIQKHKNRYEQWINYVVSKSILNGSDDIFSATTQMTSISELKFNVVDNITVSDPIIDNNNTDDYDSDENETDDEVIDEAYTEDIILEHEYDDTYADNIIEIVEPIVTIDAVDEVDEWGF